ncbi:DUF1016 N-terminal domain-containing protein [Paraburkholderia panacisoli]|uniref:DUF1016 N-terminal domain-containing protein n=1 Tax=Paraburkholderia panacisoli TaxID=2603818 RepID=UPI003CCC63F8
MKVAWHGTPASGRRSSWAHYVRLMRRTRSPEERSYYEAEALRGGWSVRQLERQIGTQFYTRTPYFRTSNCLLRNWRKPVANGKRTIPSRQTAVACVAERTGNPWSYAC